MQPSLLFFSPLFCWVQGTGDLTIALLLGWSEGKWHTVQGSDIPHVSSNARLMLMDQIVAFKKLLDQQYHLYQLGIWCLLCLLQLLAQTLTNVSFTNFSSILPSISMQWCALVWIKLWPSNDATDLCSEVTVSSIVICISYKLNRTRFWIAVILYDHFGCLWI